MTTHYATARAHMVEGQVRANDVTDTAVISAMAFLPRELYVAANQRHLAYADVCPPVKPGRVLLDPRALAKLLQLAEVQAEDRVLDVACGSGYSTAALCQISQDVVALEEDPELAAMAAQLLAKCPKAGTLFGAVGPHAAGYAERAPYDLIFVNGAIRTVPQAWVSQLKQGGRIAAVVAQGPVGKAHLFVCHGDSVSGRVAFDATVPLLPGFAERPAFAF